jgi:DUF2975 family protein
MTSPSHFPDPLRLSRKVLRVLVVVNVIYGVFILAMLVASLAAPQLLLRALKIAETETSSPMGAVRLIMISGIISAMIGRVILWRLQEIVETVSDGDPFVTGNANRLEKIAWSLLALEVLHVLIGAMAASVSPENPPIDVDLSISLTRWIAVLMLFVLARVFDQGARMRADLEGTV